MAKRLYVGNLPFDMTEDQLHELFSPLGHVSTIHLVTDFNSGESRGFAFVEMPSDSDAMNAVDTLNKTKAGGREIIVNEARPRTEPSANRGKRPPPFS